jgi:hypothetical protein
MGLAIGLTAVIKTTVVDKYITHSLSGMWKEAGIYDALYGSGDKTAKEVLPVLKEGLAKMKADPERFKKFNAPNGWGTYSQAVPWLEELIMEFEECPDGVVWVSR